MSELSLSSRYLDLELQVEKFPIYASPSSQSVRPPSPATARPSLALRPLPQPPQAPVAATFTARPLLPENSRNFRSKVDTWLLRRELELQERADRKFQIEKQELAECTFRPQINKKFPISQEISDLPFDRRLYADGRRRLETRRHAERLKSQLEEISDRISDRKRDPSPKCPIENRTQQFLEARQEKLEKMRSEISRANPFRPKISDRSRAIAEAAGRSVEPVETRLLRNFRSSQQSRSSSPGDERRSLREVRPVSATFMRRQDAFVQGRAKKLEIVDSEVNRDCTFSPKISRRSRELSITRGERNVETVTQRLGVEYVEQQKRKSHEISVSTQPSFRPTITPMSEVLAATGRSLAPVHDRLYREAREKGERLGSYEESIDSSRASEAVSVPSIHRNPKYAHVSPVYTLDDPEKISAAVSDHLARREERLQQLRAEREARELAECTFVPRISDRPLTASNAGQAGREFASTGTRTPRSARPVLVRGLDRFLELRRLAETQKTEEELRRRKVWQMDVVHRSPKKVITVPSPFNLSRSPKKPSQLRGERDTPRSFLK